MVTMPLPSATGQPDNASDWFATAPGQCLLESESAALREAFSERPMQPWLWLSPVMDKATTDPRRDIASRGLRLQPGPGGWRGDVRCALPLPLANESLATVVIQHAARSKGSELLLAECARVLVPGGRLWLFALNPLSPYRWRWKGHGLRATEPMPWRWRLRAAGLQPDAVSTGLGPRWRMHIDSDRQHGPGLHAAWLLRAEKRTIPLTGLRARQRLRIGGGVPAG